MEYQFYGWEVADSPAISTEYPGISTPKDLYDALSGIWCEYSCAPRLRPQWSAGNKTLGQCSITAFLVQDIFGGKVYGVPLPEGGFHCYNVAGGRKFDITSEQFGDTVLSYEDNPEQFRQVHFADANKLERYQYLCQKLKEYCDRRTEENA